MKKKEEQNTKDKNEVNERRDQIESCMSASRTYCNMHSVVAHRSSFV